MARIADRTGINVTSISKYLDGRFTRIGGFWIRRGDVEIDFVALDEEGGSILFGECKLNGRRFGPCDAQRLKEKAQAVKWRLGRRQEHFALFYLDGPRQQVEKTLGNEGVAIFTLERLLNRAA